MLAVRADPAHAQGLRAGPPLTLENKLGALIRANNRVAVSKLIQTSTLTPSSRVRGVPLVAVAVSSGADDVLDFLLEAGAPVDAVARPGSRDPRDQTVADKTPLMLAAWGGRAHAVETLLAHGAAVAPRSAVGATALHYGAQSNEGRIVALLISAGADVEALDSTHRSPLFYAAFANADDSIRQLLSHGAKTDIQDSLGRSALIEATKEGSLAAVQVLLKGGADPQQTDSLGLRPLDYADDLGPDDLRLVLAEYN